MTNNESSQGSIGDAGIEVFEDRLDNWVGTVPIWNQHTYHITNVRADASIPLVEDNNWTTPANDPYNSYRRNTQGSLGNNCAPDLVPQDLEVGDQCPATFDITIRVCNEGCLGVGPGVEVHFSDADVGVLGVVVTQDPISAGACLVVPLSLDPPPDDPPYELTVTVDDPEVFNECKEDNNVFGPEPICNVVG